MSIPRRRPPRAALVLSAALAAGLAAAPRTLVAQGYQVIVNAENSTSALPRQEVSRLFLKRVDAWPWGSAVVPVDLPDRSPTRVAFSKDVHGKSATAIKTFWQQQIFAGRAVPPVERTTDAEVVAYVREHAHAIGYVAPGTPLGRGVKAVAVVAR